MPPPEEERDVERRKSSYVTRKEVLWGAALFIGLMTAGYFVLYVPMRENRNFVVARNNLKDIAQALGAYAGDNNDGLPATFLPGVTDRQGNPVTWATTLSGYVKHIDSLESPSVPNDAATPLLATVNNQMQMHYVGYGMLASANAERRYEIKDATLIFAETIGGGLYNSYNPLPVGGRDGFLIGYDNSNDRPNRDTTRVTRLAFIGPERGPIHKRGIPALRADGGITVLQKFEDTRVAKEGNVPAGIWVPN